MLVNANLIANPKNAASILYTLLQRSGRFEQVRRGEYQLLNEPASRRGRKPVDHRPGWSDLDLEAAEAEGEDGPLLNDLVQEEMASMSRYVDDPRPTLREIS